MKKLLPRSVKNPQGFTLVELLVVVAIIAVLSVIGLTVFGNLQRGARDARRKADIDSIGKAMEANYNATVANCAGATCVGTYCGLNSCFFSNGSIPTDPIGSGITCSNNFCKYCVRAAAGAAGPCAASDTTVGAAQPPAGTSYMVCASLETATGTGGATYECRKNQQ